MFFFVLKVGSEFLEKDIPIYTVLSIIFCEGMYKISVVSIYCDFDAQEHTIELFESFTILKSSFSIVV